MSNGKVCPQCGTKYDAEHRFCQRDGATLVAESPNDSLIGAVIADRYHVLQKLGEGGMGEVYLAEHVRIKRKVAVKVMRRWMAADAVALGRFHREAENASQISHSNVATIYDFGETGDGMVYFAMEYVDGEPLSEVLKREPRVGVARSCDIVRQVADALAAAHALGILHRDLKPDNVMLGKTRVGTEQVKIVDFGISRVMDRGTQQFTSTGMVIGTPDYMSPEQLSGDALDARTDIYALALIAFRMLTGTPAFVGNNAHESLLARLTKPATRLTEAYPNVAWPDAMQAVFDRALHADPEQRFGDALEFAAALEGSAVGMPRTPEDERYLALLMQRTATPPRGYGAIDAMTPPHGTMPIPEAGGTVPRQRMWTETPPSGIPTGTTPVPSSPAVSPPAATSVTSPSRTLSRGLLTAVGVIGAGIIIAVARWRSGGAPAAPSTDSATAVAPSAATPAPPAPPPDTTAATVPAAAVSTLRSDVIVSRFVRSVFDVSSGVGHGAGFLADSSGLVVTSAHLVGRDSTVSVQVDAMHRYRALVLVADRGVAIAALPPRACRGCTVLAIPADSTGVAGGDSVVLIGSPEVGGRVRRGVATSASNQTMTASFDVSARQGGAPVSSLTGTIVAVAVRGRSGALQLAATPGIAPLMARARAARSAARVDTTSLPVWPAKRIAESARTTGASMSEKEIDAYRTRRDGFEVLVMTPQVVAWRRAATAASGRSDNPFAVDKPAAGKGTRDPLQRWSEWEEYWRERRAVVMIDASPEATRPPFAGSTKPVEFKKGDVDGFVLLRDGVEVPAIESSRVVAVPDPELYNGRTVFHSGVAVYAPEAFATGSRFRLEVRDASRPGRSIGVDLSSKTIERVRADLGPYLTP